MNEIDINRIIFTVWKKTTLTKEELDKAFEDNDFCSYLEMLINKEIKRRLMEIDNENIEESD